MYCKYCGFKNAEGSRFCQQCGKEIIDIEKNEVDHEVASHSSHKHTDQHISPYPYVISIWKLVILGIATFGIYDAYWFYRQWKSFSAENNNKHGRFALLIMALFSPLTSYSLFNKISNNVKPVNKGKGLEAGALAFLYFILTRISLGFLPLIFAQNKINTYWEKKYGDNLVRSNFGVWNWIALILIPMMTILAYYSAEVTTDNTSVAVAEEMTVTEEATLGGNDSQDEISSSVVNIYCPSTVSWVTSTGGSGVIISEEGKILTNAHIIPHKAKELFVGDAGCIVVLPDSTTGQPSEIFLADPIIYPVLSDDYDLAYLQIYASYYDKEEGKYKGTFPRTFPAFDDTTRCRNENLKLGEPVRIFGYPAISGGFSLTITEGVVSSFPGDGLIVTSAKISHGNSGGLAVDKDGCMIGVPSMVSSDESESLGVISSMSLVNDFMNEASKYPEEE